MTVRLVDVARRAGVSKSTVSNVIRGGVAVAPDTRVRVEEAIAALRYEPDGVARALKQRQSYALGLLVPETTNAVYSVLAHGAEQAAHAHGFAVLVANTDCEPATEAECARALIARRVDGVILGGACENSEIHATLLDHDVPVVLAGLGDTDDPRLGVLETDDDAAMEIVVAHLAGLGHRRVAFARHALRERSGERRAHGFAAAAARFGLELVDLAGRPTAIAAHNDSVAIDTIGRLEQAGLRVPRDVSVVGFDDIPIAAHPRIDLTTVHVDMAGMGRLAVELLLAAIAARGFVARRELLPATLVVRGSTAPRPG